MLMVVPSPIEILTNYKMAPDALLGFPEALLDCSICG
jgi:hypothetical protein